MISIYFLLQIYNDSEMAANIDCVGKNSKHQ